MAFNMKQMVVLVLATLLTVLCLAGSSTCEEGVNDQPSTKLSSGSGMPNLFLGWMKYPGLSSIAQLLKPVESALEGPTQQISDLAGQLPGVQAIATQVNQVGSSVSGVLDPTQLLGQVQNLGGGLGRR